MQHHSHTEPVLGLDTSVFDGLIADGNVDQRRQLAVQIADFLGQEEAPQAERDQVVPVALQLAADEDMSVRHALATRLTGFDRLNADLLFTIVSDVDEIALPFLSETAALNPWHMLAVLRVGDEARQATVALRPDLSPEALAFITSSLSLAVNGVLLENDGIVIPAPDFHTLFERFGDSEEMLGLMLERADMPPALRVLQARLSAKRLNALLAERGWLPANDAAELVTDAEEGTVLKILMEAPAEDLPGTVSFVIDHELLTPAIILRAACLGEMDVVAEVIAYLADVPVKRAREQMSGKGSGGFRSLHAKAGLPESSYWTLQAACDVARGEAESGIVLTPDDFGRRLIETLLTHYEAIPMAEQPRNLDMLSRFAGERTARLAKRLKADILRAA
jgi:uncharacterized protein (DUF2336 family)